eukprot:4128549-Alexandrium_andersonii.AAC.1
MQGSPRAPQALPAHAQADSPRSRPRGTLHARLQKQGRFATISERVTATVPVAAANTKGSACATNAWRVRGGMRCTWWPRCRCAALQPSRVTLICPKCTLKRERLRLTSPC